MRDPDRRPGDAVAVALLLCLLAFVAVLVAVPGREAGERQASRRLVASLGLTDLCLVTEARYTRHPSLADRHAPFQDHPLALEHFPSGAILPPPPHLTHAPLAR